MNVTLVAILMFIFCLSHALNVDDGVTIESDQVEENKAPELDNNKDVTFNKEINELLKSYVKNLKKNQEIVISSGTGYAGGTRFKKGDIHIKKEQGSKKSPEVTETQTRKYVFPFGVGAYLMSGCYKSIGESSTKATLNDDESKRRKREVNSTSDEYNLDNYCKKYAHIERTKSCEKMIQGAYALGAGFDIKYENNENSRRKTIIKNYCNYAKKFNEHSVPDAITANGIYDTTTQTMAFGSSDEYMKHLASRSNLDRYSNIFVADKKSVYGGLMGHKIGALDTGLGFEKGKKVSMEDEKIAKYSQQTDSYLFLISSSILIYDLILDQVTPWNIDTDFLADFIQLPQSYFYPNAAYEFEKFISRYGTHVIVSAKFGGEFKVIHTMQKSKVDSIEKFAQECTTDALSMFSRSFRGNVNLRMGNGEATYSGLTSSSEHEEATMKQEKAQKRVSEYTSTYISVKGGSQEVAAVVANMNQPDFGETFSSWLSTVHTYPRAFDFKFESITSVLDIDVKQLFSLSASEELDEKLCRETRYNTCKFGSTVSEFEEIWQRKLKALKFAITLYLKEKSGLTTTKLLVKKGDPACRFNILNYLAPYWSEIVTSDQEYRITLSTNLEGELGLRKNDEILFRKREAFWLAKRKDEKYSYESSQYLGEPFRSFNRSFINIFGLVLEYNENDATVIVVDMTQILREYSHRSKCDFDFRFVNMSDEYGSSYARPFVYLTYDQEDEYGQIDKRSLFTRDDYFIRCGALLKNINWNSDRILNFHPYWSQLKRSVVGVVDYLDPIQSVRRTWDLPFAVIPCQLKWSNNLMIVLPLNEDGKCLKFTAASSGEIFVVIASTPSNQKSWYTFQITTKGVVLYRAGKATLLHDESTAGSTGDENLYQNFFICLNNEVRKVRGKSVKGLSIQYGIHVDSDELGHVYLSYFDEQPLDPAFYSFGSRNADVQVLNAHLVSMSTDEQVKLRCPTSSKYTRATSYVCDYKCHAACDGCTKPHSDKHCKNCAYASLNFNHTVDGTQKTSLCVVECPKGYYALNGICEDIDECLQNTHQCQSNTYCVNTQGNYVCKCRDGFKGNHHFCQDIDECELGLDNCHPKANCTNLNGGFTCSCAKGFQGNGTYCTDLDECELRLHDCKWNMRCVNKIGTYECVCETGLLRVDDKCFDIDECLLGNHTCFLINAKCVNTYGSHECVCSRGYRLYDGSCHDINECHQHACLTHEICVNNGGSFECLCKNGFSKDDFSNKCVDINECDHWHMHQCNMDVSYCKNLPGTYECLCLEGYYKAGDTCIDVNECQLGTHSCKYPFVCINLDGSFECKCPRGFSQDETCVDINECELFSCDLNKECSNKRGSYECLSQESCPSGYDEVPTLDGTFLCADVDECENSKACPINSQCTNQVGSYKCECNTGFWMDSNRNCIDIDECSSACLNTCDLKTSFCVNERGAYRCDCKFGYTRLNNACVDINECDEGACGLANCQNTKGGFTCSCETGFYLNETSCDDINECLVYPTDALNCPQNSECFNTYGSYACKCKFGFQFNETISACVDKDECLTNHCPSSSKCKNIYGTFECICDEGFEMRDEKCVDINECQLDPFACDNHAHCLNKIGSFECVCDDGWRKNSLDLCEDIDECREDSYTCGTHSYCHNTPGSYDCHCRDGFYEDLENICVDIDECLIQETCKNNTNKKCLNKVGSYECVCRDGFATFVDGSCLDINECDQNPCDDQTSQCINLSGSYECKCHTGYQHLGSSIECVDVNECDLSIHMCSHYGYCKNTYGSYTCACKSGFVGNGTYCEDINECQVVANANDVLCNSVGTCVNTIGFYRCECSSGYTISNNTCVDVNECLHETCFSKSIVGDDVCYAFGTCKNLPGTFLCECLEGFEYNVTLGQCVDIDECKRIQADLFVSDICAKDSSHVAQCVNHCGNFSCECRNTNTTLVDLFDESKCYHRKEIRDFSFSLFMDRSKTNFLYKNLRVFLRSCLNSSLAYDFDIEMEPFHELLSTFKDSHFFPLLIDNQKWSHIEFVCEIRLKIITTHELKSYRFILLEDLKRYRCYLFESTKSNSMSMSNEIVYELEYVWDLLDSKINCENSLLLRDSHARKILFEKYKHLADFINFF